jgi:hypothetical protein
MTTELNKPVKRVASNRQWSAGKARRGIVTLYPAGFIGFRLEGTRKEETLPIAAAHAYATRCRISHERMEKAKQRKRKKEGKI